MIFRILPIFLLPSVVLCQTLYPDWRERSVLTLTNAVRMDPPGYKTRYLGNFQILLPQNYPVVNPVYWDTSLSRTALVHSIDMAANCGMQHASCDGTPAGTRITSYYKGGGGWGENIATGQTSPQAVMTSWLRDNDSLGVPAPDRSPTDGHRANIMNAGFREMGAGYGYSATRRFNHFWTQDFGGGAGDYTVIPSGSHFEFATGTTSFLVNYFATDGTAASQAVLNLNGQTYPMALQLGAANKGTFAVDQPTPASCQNYFFTVTDAQARVFRYPATGDFLVEGRTCASGIAFRSKPNTGFVPGIPALGFWFDLNGRRLLMPGLPSKP